MDVQTETKREIEQSGGRGPENKQIETWMEKDKDEPNLKDSYCINGQSFNTRGETEPFDNIYHNFFFFSVRV